MQARGSAQGSRNSKLHALTDGERRSLRFLLTGGQFADCRKASVLAGNRVAGTIVLASKAYESNAIRDLTKDRGAVPRATWTRSRAVK